MVCKIKCSPILGFQIRYCILNNIYNFLRGYTSTICKSYNRFCWYQFSIWTLCWFIIRIIQEYSVTSSIVILCKTFIYHVKVFIKILYLFFHIHKSITYKLFMKLFGYLKKIHYLCSGIYKQ